MIPILHHITDSKSFTQQLVRALLPLLFSSSQDERTFNVANDIYVIDFDPVAAKVSLGKGPPTNIDSDVTYKISVACFVSSTKYNKLSRENPFYAIEYPCGRGVTIRDGINIPSRGNVGTPKQSTSRLMQPRLRTLASKQGRTSYRWYRVPVLQHLPFFERLIPCFSLDSVTFGSIDDHSATISSSPVAVPPIRAEGVKSLDPCRR